MNNAADIRDDSRSEIPIIKRNHLAITQCRTCGKKPVPVEGDLCNGCLLAEPPKSNDEAILLIVLAVAGFLMVLGWGLQAFFGAK